MFWWYASVKPYYLDSIQIKMGSTKQTFIKLEFGVLSLPATSKQTGIPLPTVYFFYIICVNLFTVLKYLRFLGMLYLILILNWHGVWKTWSSVLGRRTASGHVKHGA